MQRLDKILSSAGAGTRKELRAAIRAGRVTVNGSVCRDESAKFDETSAQILLDGEPVELTFKKYELLKYLMSNLNHVMPREKILADVWGFDYEGESRTVDMHIQTLRQKLGDAGGAIKTVRSVGYKLGD